MIGRKAGPRGRLAPTGRLLEGDASQYAPRARADPYQAALCLLKVCTHLLRQVRAWQQCHLPPSNPGQNVAIVWVYQADIPHLTRHCSHAAHDGPYVGEGHAPTTDGRCGLPVAGPTCLCITRRRQGLSRRPSLPLESMRH